VNSKERKETSKEIIDRYIGALEDDLQHYTMVDKDSVKAKLIQFELQEYKQITQDLDRLEQLEKENQELKEKHEQLKARYKHRAKLCNEFCDYCKEYEKVIDILIENFPIKFLGYNKYGAKPYEIMINGYIIGFDKEPYELLKEVLDFEY
jgi:predicted nuclease with TOPRIM domain